jgi:4-amino-4-deoxy-L-arabinose transferase-like glycosyltransferase
MIDEQVGSLRGSMAEHRWFYLSFALIALALGLLFVFLWPVFTFDSGVYGNIAKTWLERGVYGLSAPDGSAAPTLIRLPGYPAFLAACFVLFGREHYHAVMFVQVIFNLLTCFLIAAMALRIAGERAARIAFALAATCIFFANYAAAVLSESLAILFTALALERALAAMDVQRSGRPATRQWLGCGLVLCAGIYLRPDTGILLIALIAYLAWRAIRLRGERWPDVAAIFLAGLVAVAPLAPWAERNWRTFHVIEPLAPEYANNPGEFVFHGYMRWQKTWMVEYVSVEEIWFRIDGEPVDPSLLPKRAFDTPEERERTLALLAKYNDELTITPELDREFAQLAAERIRRHPLRFYVWLPLLRAADLWLRPHTELMEVDPHWWWFRARPRDALINSALGLLGIFYVAMAIMGGWRGSVRYGLLFMLFFAIRTAFLATMPNPESRYVLECFPPLLALAAAGITRWRNCGTAEVRD